MVPPEWVKVNREYYFAAFNAEREVFSPDGLVPDGAPERVLAMVRGVNEAARAASIDLARTYSNRFAHTFSFAYARARAYARPR